MPPKHSPDPNQHTHPLMPIRARRRGYTTSGQPRHADEQSRIASIQHQSSTPIFRTRPPVSARAGREALKDPSAQPVRATITRIDRTTRALASAPSFSSAATTPHPSTNDLKTASMQPPIRPSDPPTLRQKPSIKTVNQQVRTPRLQLAATTQNQPPTGKPRKVPSGPLHAQAAVSPVPAPAPSRGAAYPAPSLLYTPQRVITGSRLTASSDQTDLTDLSAVSGASTVAAIHADLFGALRENRSGDANREQTLKRLTARTEITTTSTESGLTSLIGALEDEAVKVLAVGNTLPPPPPKKLRDLQTGLRIHRISTASIEAVHSRSPSPEDYCPRLPPSVPHPPRNTSRNHPRTVPISSGTQDDALHLSQLIPRPPSNASLAGLCSVAMLTEDEESGEAVAVKRRFSEASVMSQAEEPYRALQDAANHVLCTHPLSQAIRTAPGASCDDTFPLDAIEDEHFVHLRASMASSNIHKHLDSCSWEDYTSVSELSVNSCAASTESGFSEVACDECTLVATVPPNETLPVQDQPVASPHSTTNLSRAHSTNHSLRTCKTETVNRDTLRALGVRWHPSERTVAECEIFTMLNYLTEVSASSDSSVAPVILANRIGDCEDVKTVVRAFSHSEQTHREIRDLITHCWDRNGFRHSCLMPWFWWALRTLVKTADILAWLEELWIRGNEASRLRITAQVLYWVTFAWRPKHDDECIETLKAFVCKYVLVGQAGERSTADILAALGKAHAHPPKWPNRALMIYHAHDEAPSAMPLETDKSSVKDCIGSKLHTATAPLDQVAYRGPQGTNATLAFPSCGNIAGYICNEGVEVFAEHLTMLISDRFRKIHPWKLALAWLELGDQKPSDLDADFRHLYECIRVWVLSMIDLNSDTFHPATEVFWLEVGKILLLKHHNFVGAQAIAEALDACRLQENSLDSQGEGTPLPSPLSASMSNSPPISSTSTPIPPRRPRKRSFVVDAYLKVCQLPRKVTVAPTKPEPVSEAAPDASLEPNRFDMHPYAWVDEILRIARLQYGKYIRETSPINPQAEPCIPILGTHKQAILALRSTGHCLVREHEGVILLNLFLIRLVSKVVETLQSGHIPFQKLIRNERIIDWLQETLARVDVLPTQAYSSTFCGLDI